MKKQLLDKSQNANADLLFWLKEYLLSKIYVIASDNNFNREYYYNKLENTKTFDEVKDTVAEIQRSGMYNLSSYSGHLFKYYEYVSSKKKIKSIRELGNDFINIYIELNPFSYKVKTLDSHYTQIKSLYKFIDNNFWDEKNEFSGFKIGYTASGKKSQSPVKKTEKDEPLYLEPKQFIHLLEKLEKYPFRIGNKNQPILMIKLLAFSGLRIKELSEIKRDHVSFINNITEDLPEKTKYMRIKVIGKGNKERIVYVKASLVEDNYDEIISDAELECGYLFCTRKNGKYAVRTIYDFLARVYKFAGVHDKYSAHMLRRTYYSILAIKGISIEQLKILMGHYDEEMTEIYVHVSNKQLKDVIPLLENL